MAYYGSLKNEYAYPRGVEKPGQSGWIVERLLRLRDYLGDEIRHRRQPNSLIIGSWNIRHFDGGRKRMKESFHYIAEIIDHFDICAIQEVKDIDAMDRLKRLLGPNWDYFINDSSGAGRGNHERMAFIYNTNTVRFRNLIGELVMPADALPGREQIGRTPFFAAFQAGWFKFTLCSAHIIFNEEPGRPTRADEIRVVATELAKRARKTGEVHVFLGDMNIESRDSAEMRALTDQGFDAPDVGTTDLNGTKYYDQIAFTGAGRDTRQLNHGVVRWHDVVFSDADAPAYEAKAAKMRGEPYKNWTRSFKSWRTHEMSDHLPIWVELETDYSDEYLQGIKALSEARS